MMGEAALGDGFHVRQLAHERRHFIQLVRPDGQVILQPLNVFTVSTSWACVIAGNFCSMSCLFILILPCRFHGAM